jgi:hypothetical protein
MSPNADATGKLAATTVVECVGNCDAVLFNACTACPATFDNVVLVAFSISIHFTSIYPLYDKYERPITNNPITIAAIFITFLMTYPATAPNRNLPSAENTIFSINKLLGISIPNLDYYMFQSQSVLAFCLFIFRLG